MTHDPLEHEFAKVKEDLRGDWDERKTEAQLSAFKAQVALRRMKRIRNASMVAIAALLMLGFVAYLALGQDSGPATIQSSEMPVIVLEDGSSARSTVTSTDLKLVEATPKQVRMKLAKGSARFKVTPNKSRRFRVEASDTTIEVLGTTFDVTHTKSGLVKVFVVEGLVRVTRGNETNLLRANESITLAPNPRGEESKDTSDIEAVKETEPEELQARSTKVPKSKPSPRPKRKPSKAKPKQDWRLLVKARDFKTAVVLLLKEHTQPTTVEDMMLAADAMRGVRRYEDAIKYHKRVLKKHPKDPRAPLAAYTMGRILLKKLGKPKQAAQAFAKVQKLRPRGTLSEDALAREVESWSKAKDSARATQRALDYVDRFPQGLHLQKVQRLGGLN